MNAQQILVAMHDGAGGFLRSRYGTAVGRRGVQLCTYNSDAILEYNCQPIQRDQLESLRRQGFIDFKGRSLGGNFHEWTISAKGKSYLSQRQKRS